MSKPVKELVFSEYRTRFGDMRDALIVDIRGLEANANNAMRLDLRSRGIRVTIVKNSLARRAFDGTGMASLLPALEGPSAIAWGGDSVVEVARQLVSWAKREKTIDLKGAILDGEYFAGAEGVKQLSTFPTREEAQGQAIQLILSPARRVLAAISGPGGALASLLESIGDRLEDGGTIEKTG